MTAQVSIEYLIVLGLAAILLISALVIFPQQLSNSTNQEAQAQAKLKELKLLTTAASTSTTAYEANMSMPKSLGTVPVNMDILEQDGAAIITNTQTGQVLARVQLPRIDAKTELEEADTPDHIYITKQNSQLVIRAP